MSKSQPRTGQLVTRLTRRERGTPIPVETKRVTLKDGSIGQVLTLSLGGAEVPERSYLGEACSVAYGNHTLMIAFAQPKLGGDGLLRSLLLIAMTPNAAVQFLRSVEEMKDPSLPDIARIVEIESEPLMAFPADEPDQTASVIANVVAVAVQGRETTMDFYHANAFSHLHMRVQKEIYLEPVVRVNVRTSLVLSLMEDMKEMRAQFPSADANAAEEEAK